MIPKAQWQQELNRIIDKDLREDVVEGDHSTLACIPATATGRAKLLVKDEGILAGVAFATQVFHAVDSNLNIEVRIKDGSAVHHGDIAFYVVGSTQSIITAERLVLNAMQRMSAIATKTKRLVDLLAGTQTKLLDTRKTTPGIRALEKWAVTLGGGANHRFGLYDMMMLKDNHIDFAGGITRAIQKTQHYLKETGRDLKIIVEARNIEEVEQILQAQGIHRILLDNFNIEDTRKAVARIGNQCATESSGNIDESNLRQYAACGVDYISCGALTHSVHNMDLSLKAV